MQLILITAVLGGALALALGGSLNALAATKFRALWLLFLALGIQLIFIFGRSSFLAGAGVWVFSAAQVALAAFLIANHSLPGMKVAALGFLLNATVIAANGAMPVSARAELTVHDELPPAEGAGYKHERLDDDTVLPWLGDVIALRGVETVVSAGDVLIAAGIGLLVYGRTRTDEARGKHSAK
ncbi:MAG TPA: DUF5317 domain-containing protein [Actinomycetota bacterium]|nr:DUF5317 domain-containing protein [Actinomycetota bacterium]